MADILTLEGTKEELTAFIARLPAERYRIQVVPVATSTDPLPEPPEGSYLAELVRQAQARTPEEIMATRQRLLAKAIPAQPLPEGKTLDDVVRGQWPGDETDEEILRALEQLS